MPASQPKPLAPPMSRGPVQPLNQWGRDFLDVSAVEIPETVPMFRSRFGPPVARAQSPPPINRGRPPSPSPQPLQPSRSRGSEATRIVGDSMMRSQSAPQVLSLFGCLQRDASEISLPANLKAYHHMQSDAEESDEDMPAIIPLNQPVPEPKLLGYARHAANVTTGNAGFYFANFGNRAKDKDLQDVIDAQLKRNPAHMMFICEMPAKTQDILHLPPRPNPPTTHGDAAVAAFYQRNEAEWFTYRQNDAHGDPCCIAVRRECSVHPHLTMLADEVKFDGTKKGGANCYTRTLVCTAHLPEKMSVGYIGRDIVGMCMHLHHMTAKNHQGFKEVRIQRFDRAAELAKQHAVTIFAADANMSMCCVPDEFNKRGVSCVTVACFPWRTGPHGVNQHIPCLDSCGIWILGIPVEAKLEFPLSSVLDEDAEDAWHIRCAEIWEEGKDRRDFEYYPETRGPGKRIKMYLPPGKNLKDKFSMLLHTPWPTTDSLRAVALARDGDPQSRILNDKPEAGRRWLKTNEKRLPNTVWAKDGRFHSGSHFPLLVFTANECRRSEEAWLSRAKKKHAKPRLNKKQKGGGGDQPQPSDESQHPWKVVTDAGPIGQTNVSSASSNMCSTTVTVAQTSKPATNA